MKAKRARHKTGRDKISTSFSIPQSQIDWLNEHQEINGSHLVSSLLAVHIEATNAVQPEKVKLILKLRSLRMELEKAKKEMNSAEYSYRFAKASHEQAVQYLQNLKHLSQLPTNQLKLFFDEENMPGSVNVADGNSKNHMPYVTVEHRGQKEPEQIKAIILNKLKEVEDVAYQNKLEKLKQDIALPQSIYKAFEQTYENISKQIQEIENLIVKEG